MTPEQIAVLTTCVESETPEFMKTTGMRRPGARKGV